jgi:hypothetical protein
MEPRIRYSRTADGASIALLTLEESLAHHGSGDSPHDQVQEPPRPGLSPHPHPWGLDLVRSGRHELRRPVWVEERKLTIGPWRSSDAVRPS